MKTLDFRPLIGLKSGHLQTIVAGFTKLLVSPPSTTWQIPLGNSDSISCELTTPEFFNKIVVLVHGLGGSHQSNYMVRMAKKLCEKNVLAVRVNLRGCGSGQGLSSLPYHGGRSEDLLAVLKAVREKYPTLDIYSVGFSLGANVVLKLAGELGNEATGLIKKSIAVCCPLDFRKTVLRMQQRKFHFYHSYYLKKICKQAETWLKDPILTSPIQSIYDFDDRITARLWGFSGADDYYQKNSSIYFLAGIQHECHLLFAEDDPFVPVEVVKEASKIITDSTNIWVTKHGGHMGYLGKTTPEHKSQWLDQQLLSWIV